ncbi:serine/threonine-protein kinase [Desulfosporosinus meridiei]|uniref:Protein kinase family protein n=1 Tax=Desulfosporosinus meridiei (strain ATCC BAA-275 / DSM 13257 / KCTC 12902 / NCIMB 13706 / S10) TaxID=768704 RepID=J7IYN8_DESMD|nr:serine/threonine-protein kinase [Desulfosporosinus meridiei]AFQ45264.1 protein kinase family protein [Desulfosporosinus meridiei DSM 13257]
MVPEYILKIDEHHIGIEVSKLYKNEYRFPTEMLASGRKYSGVEVTLNKPHGKKVIMEFVLKLLLKGPKQYKPFVNQVLQRFTWLDLNDSLEILLLDGVIQITFKNQKPRKTVDWLPKIIQLDPRAMECLIERGPDYNLELMRIKDSVINLLSDSGSPMKDYLLQWIEDAEIKDQSGAVIADCTSFKKYKSIVLSVAYYVNLKEKGSKLPLRYLSNQIWSQPGLLNNYKNEIALSAGITLDELNSVFLPDINNTLHAPLILISPVEELQKLVVKLIESEIQQDSILFYINEMNCCLQRIGEVVGDSTESALYTFLQVYNDCTERLVEVSSKEVQLSILNDLKYSINVLKKEILKIGQIKQQFELIVLKEIGSGSFARVYRVFDPESNTIVACKVLFPRSYFKQVYGNDGDEYILRFKREVRLLTKELRHKNIVEVEKIQLEGTPFWFTMPLASFSLEKWIKDNHDASVDQRIKIFDQIVSGIKYLHEKDKYHRDLAPNNILLYETKHGLKVKIADFGLAKDPESVSFRTSLSKKSYGQEDFTDPEQLNNLADSTHLSDIYSLGALLYYLLSSKLPKKRFYVPVMCQSVVMKAMDKRGRRYQSIYEFEKDLNDCIKSLGN